MVSDSWSLHVKWEENKNSVEMRVWQSIYLQLKYNGEMEFCAVSRTEFSNAAFHKAWVALGELGVVSRV